jgi:hypothetical protein
MRIRDGKNLDPGWKKFGSEIWDKYPGSATLECGMLFKTTDPYEYAYQS